jgi:septal ring factor EnvC (AmiA/AmiB activator)
LDHRAAEKRQSLNGQRKQLGSLIAALQRIALHPPVALIALPATPADTIRSALLLRGTVPEIETRAQVLREDIKALSEIRAAITAARQKIQSGQRDLTGERRALAALTSKKLKLAKTTSAAQLKLGKRAQALGSKAKDLKDLVRRLAADQRKKARAGALKKEQTRAANRAKPPTLAPNRKNVTSAPKSPITNTRTAKTQTANLPRFPRRGLPVAGRIAVTFGGKDHNGQKSSGLSIRARPNATVIAPSSGKVVFAGRFRGLGNLLIIEYSRQYHLLLGRLARIDVPVGEKVLAGEPVGIIPSTELTGTTLYLELRRNGRPINPLPWLAARRDRKRG